MPNLEVAMEKISKGPVCFTDLSNNNHAIWWYKMIMIFFKTLHLKLEFQSVERLNF